MAAAAATFVLCIFLNATEVQKSVCHGGEKDQSTICTKVMDGLESSSKREQLPLVKKQEVALSSHWKQIQTDKPAK
jgi:hypothetical protein